MVIENSTVRSGGSGLKPLSVTVPTALALTGIGRTKLYALIKAGRVKVTKIDNRTLVNFASLENLIAGEAA
jgi:hypothetical protein